MSGAPSAERSPRRRLERLRNSGLGQSLRTMRRGIRSGPGSPAVPEGWVTGAPDFVGIGAQKSGTTWWFTSIIRHPEIQGEVAKETHFFDSYANKEFGDDDVARYHRMFPRPEGRLIGEWTPRYMHDFWTPGLLHGAAPDARLLVILRDPMSRFISGVGHEAARVLGSVRKPRRSYFEAMIADDALDRSMYSRQLLRILAHFDRDRLLVLQYEQCVLDPAAALRRTFDFLGVDPDAPGVLSPPLQRVGRSHPRAELPDRVLEDARVALEQDAARLRDMFPDVDLELWPTVRGAVPRARPLPPTLLAQPVSSAA